jgi:acyl carrier protein
VNIEESVRLVVKKHTVAPLGDAEAATANLLAEGYLESIGIVSLTFELQNAFGVQFKPEQLVPTNFQSVNAIADLVRQAIAGSDREPSAR